MTAAMNSTPEHTTGDLPDYENINRESWNSRTDVHFESAFYDNPSFLKGRSSLNSIELPLLGDLKGKTVLHLQCHFGQDTISMARMGAIATGVDLSDRAIERANELTEATGTDCRFIRCNIYDLPEHLDEQFDVVFASYGTICWLPDINRWAELAARYLKPGGRFVFAEFHPVLWMFDDEFQSITYSYFNSDPIQEEEEGTYTDTKETPILKECVTWNHGLAEVTTALLDQGLEMKALREYDYSPYNCFKGTVEFETGKFRISHLGDKVPMVYALTMEKPMG